MISENEQSELLNNAVFVLYLTFEEYRTNLETYKNTFSVLPDTSWIFILPVDGETHLELLNPKICRDVDGLISIQLAKLLTVLSRSITQMPLNTASSL